MSDLDPLATTVGDLCADALREAGVSGLGQTPRHEDINLAWARMQWLLQSWERKRLLVYALQTIVFPSTGAQFYTFGPGGTINSLAGLTSSEGEPLGPLSTSRIHRIESAFVRLYSQTSAGGTGPGGGAGSGGGDFDADFNADFNVRGAAPAAVGNDFNADFNNDFGTAGAGLPPASPPGGLIPNLPLGGGPLDLPLRVIQSFEDYNKIRLKTLQSLPRAVYYQPSFPLGVVFIYPVPQANLYGIGLTYRAALPTSFPKLATTVSLPPEYYSAVVYNLAIMLRSSFNIPSYQGDPLPSMAKMALATIRGANTNVRRLSMPRELAGRGSSYNIFSDNN